MLIKVNAILPIGNSKQVINVFGHTSKSLPGIEIIGLNGKGRLLKEKLTFLTKKMGLKVPIKKFILCVEGEGLEKIDTEFLELPLLFCFWSMAEILPFKNFENGYLSGKFELDKEITILDGSYYESKIEPCENNIIFSCTSEQESSKPPQNLYKLKVIDLKEVFEDCGLNFKWRVHVPNQ